MTWRCWLLRMGLGRCWQAPGRSRQSSCPKTRRWTICWRRPFVTVCSRARSCRPGHSHWVAYTAIARGGLRPGKFPLEVSLEGIFLAIRGEAGADLTDPEANKRFLDGWSRMSASIMHAAEQAVDPFTTPFLADEPEFARERAFLASDQQVYRQDVARGERWLVGIDGGPPMASGLLLRSPKSVLFKHWAWCDTEAPTGDMYLFLVVSWGEGEWVFSTDPVQRLSLKSLAEAMQTAEARETREKAAESPWFDGEPFNYTLVAAPRSGTVLSEEQVLRVVKRWAHARPAVRSSRRRVLLAAGSAVGSLLLAGVGLSLYSAKVKSVHRRLHRGVDFFEDPPPITRPKEGNLYLLCVGVSRYNRSEYVLKVAARDADALAEAFAQQEGRFFKSVQSRVLTDEEASKESILKGLRWLEDSATELDLVVVTFAGHGIKDRHDDFFFLPYDYDPAKEPANSGLSWRDMRTYLGHTAAMVLVVMDTCHSGRITKGDAASRVAFRGSDSNDIERTVARAAADFSQSEKGVVIMAAASSSQSAHEQTSWGHGAFSMAVIEAMTHPATRKVPSQVPLPAPPEGLITLEEIRQYVIQRVKELTDGQQTVITNHSGNIPYSSIPMAIIPKSDAGDGKAAPK